MNTKHCALILAFGLLFSACGGGAGPDTRPIPTQFLDRALPQSTATEVGLPADSWNRVLREIDDKQMPVDQISILIKGKQVAALHRNGFSETTMHDLRSATKSITALLVGIAVDKGLIKDLDTPVDGYFPEWPSHPSRANYPPLTLRHLLTMRSGLDCDDWTDTPGNEERMYRSANWVRFFQDIPARRAPGSAYSYCTAGVVVLGEIVARASGQRLPEFAQAQLFDPLGIRNVRWADAGASITDAGGHLRLTLNSMLKIGELVRRGGEWEGNQVVSAQWLGHMLRPTTAAPFPPESGLKAQYGMLWWLEPVRDGVARSYQARGNGGQYIINVPEVELVVAVTGHAYNQGNAQLAAFSLVDQILIPALRHDLTALSSPPTLSRLCDEKHTRRSCPE